MCISIVKKGIFFLKNHIRALKFFLKINKKIISSRFRFQSLLKSQDFFSLYIMHSWGGGTETYLKNILQRQKNYLVLRSFGATERQEFLTLESDTFSYKIFISKKDIKKLQKIISAVSLENLCGYKSLPFVLKVLQTFAVPVSFKLHDYYSLCPSINLMKGDSFCNFSTCDSCTFFLGAKKYSGTKWQNMWQDFFNFVTHIYVFSHSSKQIFTSKYSVPEEKIILPPHSMAYFKTQKITALPEKMNIAIFGSITSEAKGRTVVLQFTDFSKGKDYMLYLNGKLNESDKPRFSENCIYAGSYTPEKIYERLITQRIGVVFFPSVCPETFSYLVSELIETGIPVACFGIGAQAEKIKNYRLGKIITDTDCDTILQSLRDCYELGRKFYISS